MALFVALFFFLIYLLSPNQLFSFDAITNAIACERGGLLPLLHSNHLLYPFLGAGWFKLERLFSYSGYAIYSLARFNSLLAAMGLGLFYSALSRSLTRVKAVIAAAFLGSTYAVWHYAVDGRAIGITIFFSSLLILFLLSNSRFVLLGSALSSLYVFSHAIAIFHIFPVAWYISKRMGKRSGLIYLTGSLLIIGAVYMVAYLILRLPLTPHDFLAWGLGYAGHSGSTQALNSPFWAKSAREIILGLWHGWANAFMLRPYFFSHGIAGLFLIGLGLAGQKIKTRSDSERALFWALTSWGILITVFLAFWSPGQEGFRLHVLVPWTAALFLAFKDVKAVFQTTALAAALVFSFNLSGPISHNATIKNNKGYQLLSELQSHLKPADLVLSGTGESIPDYEVLRPYFFPKIAGGTLFGWLLLSKQTNFDALITDFKQKLKEGRTLYWMDDVLNPDLQKTLENRHQLESGAVEKLQKSFATKPAFQLSNGAVAYEVKNNHQP